MSLIKYLFIDLLLSRCRYTGCYSYYCGLHLYQKSDDSDLQRIEKLKSDIAYLKSQGVLVKLAYGGEEYGNTYFAVKVCNIAVRVVEISNGGYKVRKIFA